MFINLMLIDETEDDETMQKFYDAISQRKYEA